MNVCGYDWSHLNLNLFLRFLWGSSYLDFQSKDERDSFTCKPWDGLDLVAGFQIIACNNLHPAGPKKSLFDFAWQQKFAPKKSAAEGPWRWEVLQIDWFFYIYNYIYICSFLGGNTGKSYVYTHIYIYIHTCPNFSLFFPTFWDS